MCSVASCYGRVFHDHTSGLLNGVAARTLKSEQAYAAYKQAERDRRLAHAPSK